MTPYDRGQLLASISHGMGKAASISLMKCGIIMATQDDSRNYNIGFWPAMASAEDVI